jgi:NAD-dependent dihydropyrimidine dehydrogenase PreA subunit
LSAIGQPDAESPVLVTANFTLTVKRVRQALAGRNAWLLVVNTEGINVWCAAAGDIFTEHRVIDGIKVSRLAAKVSHRELILPALSAPGVDRDLIERESGFSCRFGPVYAADLPAYLGADLKKSDAMLRFNFGLKHRLDMFLPMNFPVYLLVAAVLAIAAPAHVLGFTVFFWAAVASLYLLIDVVPGRTGWGQALLLALLVAIGWAGLDWHLHGTPLAHWGWLVAAFFVYFAAGFDIAGTLSPRVSDAENMMRRLGFKSFGAIYVETAGGQVQLDRGKCIGCGTCIEICPIGVFAGLDANQKTTFRDQQACFACGACVKQCPADALSLDDSA